MYMQHCVKFLFTTYTLPDNRSTRYLERRRRLTERFQVVILDICFIREM